MGRLGISYVEVAKAAEALQQKGIKPTVDGVRTLLGTGSKSTIVPYLRQWKGSQKTYFEEGEPFSAVQLLALIRNLYARLEKEDNTKTNKEDRQISELLNVKLELTQKLEEEETLRQQLQKEIIILKTQFLLSEKKRSYLLSEKSDLKKELQALGSAFV